ncbi:hypothetical protein P43SY_003517 [Pythium insidiosum]|uniref:Glutaredoxin domain-containing protein n=1 Tax=Pythium insidiosum TaxID=114742 RepID=A0AAD5Q6W4_PYTIN|nr:hypothetical protein P43SY_003517 [Pythium insidiosum]KAJ0405205.1 hypothetical protein ATCC90586_001157 [Pythium insidiosum]
MAKECVVLTSSMVSIADQKAQIEKTKHILDGNRIIYTEIDCSMEDNRATRDRYFELSGVRGNYPQVFLQSEDGQDIKYLGSFAEIEQLNEMCDIPQEILDANKIQTLKTVFQDVPRRQ